MSDDISFDVKVAIQRAVLFHPLFEGTAAEALEIAIAVIKAGDEICVSSPAQEPVTTEPIAWTNEAQLGFLKEPGYRVVPMAMWAFQHSAHPIALYAIPAPPQPPICLSCGEPAVGECAPPQPGRDANDKHYLTAIRRHLERLYSIYPNNARLREQISDEIDWIDAALAGGPK